MKNDLLEQARKDLDAEVWKLAIEYARDTTLFQATAIEGFRKGFYAALDYMRPPVVDVSKEVTNE